MAIAFDVGNSGGATATNTITVGSITVAGSNRCLIAFGHGTTQAPTNITFDGTTFDSNSIDTLAQDFNQLEAWYLVAPTTTANRDLVMTLAGTTDEVGLGFASYTGVDQTTPVGTPGTTFGDPATATDTTPSMTVSSATDEQVVCCIAYLTDGSAGSIAADSPQVQRCETLDIGSFLNIEISDEVGAATSTVGYTITNISFGTGMMGFPLKPVAAGGATGKSNPINGPIGGPISGPVGM